LIEKTLTYRSGSRQETIEIGRRLGRLLKEGDVIALSGELGSGKTCMTKGLALGLGVPENEVITSPSFTFMNEYEGRETLYHMDVYRLAHLSEFLGTGLDEYLGLVGVAVLEWADRWPEILPEQTLAVTFVILGDDARALSFCARHPRSIEIVEGLERATGRME
jgi:tRNA threonylcarbamoyladenosine biosynthesis protein TsaE